MFHIRAARPDDAVALLDLHNALDRETRFMMLEEGERPQDAEAVRQGLVALKDNDVVLVALDGEQVQGYVAATGGEFRRIAHRAELVLGIRGTAAGYGLGTALLAAAEAWARERQLRRLELTVMAHNLRAINLYLRAGFLVEGLRRASMCVDGQDVDEYALFKLLPLSQ